MYTDRVFAERSLSALTFDVWLKHRPNHKSTVMSNSRSLPARRAAAAEPTAPLPLLMQRSVFIYAEVKQQK